jgi:hypothetical protein
MVGLSPVGWNQRLKQFVHTEEVDRVLVFRFFQREVVAVPRRVANCVEPEHVDWVTTPLFSDRRWRRREPYRIAESFDDIHPLLVSLAFVVSDDGEKRDILGFQARNRIETAIYRRDVRRRVVEEVAGVNDGVHVFVDGDIHRGIECISEVGPPDVASVLSQAKVCVADVEYLSHLFVESTTGYSGISVAEQIVDSPYRS